MKYIIQTDREFYTHFNSLAGLVRYLNLPVLGYYALLVILPVLLLPGCTKPGPRQDVPFTGTGTDSVPVKVTILKSDKDAISDMDIFVFNDDALQRLDCYQRFGGTDEGILEIASRSGDKKITVCANSQRDRDQWKGINSRESLSYVMAELEKEHQEHPLMTAETRVRAGNDGSASAPLCMERLASEIVLRSISCDFSGKPYAAETLKDVKVYLTNVNASCKIMAGGDIAPERIINSGCLCHDDLEKFSEPGIIAQVKGRPIGKETFRADITMLCYPNCGTQESPGSPFTRLVIEGKAGDSTWYWPIDINRNSVHQEGNGRGIERNCRYVYDLKIRRKGSSDPDIPVSAEDLEINLEIKEWNTKEEYGVRF